MSEGSNTDAVIAAQRILSKEGTQFDAVSVDSAFSTRQERKDVSLLMSHSKMQRLPSTFGHFPLLKVISVFVARHFLTLYAFPFLTPVIQFEAR